MERPLDNDAQRSLILVRGLPGSGKTTIARMLVGSLHSQMIEPSSLLVSADDYFTFVLGEYGEYEFDPEKLKDAHDWCQREAFAAMSDGDDLVVVHNTFTTMWEMNPYLAVAKLHDYSIQVIECKGNFGSVHDVPAETIDRMRNRWEEYDEQA